MRDALELRVFPPIPECPRPSDMGFAYEDWHECRADERKLIKKKRLTEQEMAAEVWHSIVKFYSREPSVDAVEEACRNAVIERFATHPHYDEAVQ